MAGPVHLPLHGVEIIILDFGLPADLCRGSIRDHAELSLDLGKCRFDIEPFLHDILIAENAAHRFSAELVLEQPAVDDVRAHGLSPFYSFQAYSFHAGPRGPPGSLCDQTTPTSKWMILPTCRENNRSSS